MGKSVTRKQIHEMLDLVLDINGMEARTREKTGDKPTAHIHFKGHIGSVNIEVFQNGWDNGAKADLDIYVDLNGNVYELIKPNDIKIETVDDVIKLLKSIKNDRRHKAERSQTR